RPGEIPRRCDDGPDPRRAHHRPLRGRAHRRGGGGDGVPRLGRGHRHDLPCTSLAGRGDEGRGTRGRQARTEHLRILARLLFGLFLLPAIAGAQSDAVDQYMKAQLEQRRIPGAALAVMRRGEVVKLQGYGLANVELEVPVTPDSVFELASVTKQFTATAIML